MSLIFIVSNNSRTNDTQLLHHAARTTMNRPTQPLSFVRPCVVCPIVLLRIYSTAVGPRLQVTVKNSQYFL